MTPWALLVLACTTPGPELVPPEPYALVDEEQRSELDDTGLGACSPPLWLEMPIVWNAERERLTAAYQAHHRGPHAVTGDDAADSTMLPRVIVLHWTGGPSVRSAWHTFAPAVARDRRWGPDHQRLNLAAHFIVDRDGTIFRALDETKMGRHAIGLNHLSVGVENVGDHRNPLTRAQIDANVALVRYLAETYPITHLIAHSEYRRMEEHPYFEEIDPRHRTRRDDPGVAFMEAVRARVADLGLEGPPDPTAP